MTDKEYLINILNIVEKYGDSNEPSYINQWPSYRDDVEKTEGLSDDLKNEDQRFVRLGNYFEKWITDDYFDVDESDAWYWHIASIVKGEYPLDTLPEHVREVAKELYYD